MMTKMDDENGEDAKIGFFFIQELQVSLSVDPLLPDELTNSGRLGVSQFVDFLNALQVCYQISEKN
jgi:hypothetical protein